MTGDATDAAPRVAVVMTTFRTPSPLLREALESLTAQTLAELEVLVVCDGHPGPAQEAELAAATADPRIRVLRPGRIGRGAALNLGVCASTAPLIAIQDADDESHPRRLEWQVAMMEAHPEVAILGTEVVKTRDQMAHADWPLPATPPQPRLLGRSLLLTNPIVHTSVLMRRDAVLGAGSYDQARRWQFDHDLYLRIHRRGGRIAVLDAPLVLKRLHVGQVFESSNPLPRLWSSYRLQLGQIRRQPPPWRPVLVAGATGRFGARLARSGLRRARRRAMQWDGAGGRAARAALAPRRRGAGRDRS